MAIAAKPQQPSHSRGLISTPPESGVSPVLVEAP